MNKTHKILAITVFAAAFFWIYSGGLRWGTPLQKRSSQIFRGDEELKKYVPEMVRLREGYYQSREEIFKEKGSIDTGQIKKAMEETFGHAEKSAVFGEVPRAVVLDGTRGYFISPNLSDEAHAIFPLSAMNPKKLDFDPKNYVYGGLYYYTVGAALVKGKILGIISLSRDISRYFFNPKETANMYAIVRGLNVVLAFIAALLIYIIVFKLTGNRLTAMAGLIFFVLTPLLFMQTHLCKPHILSMFFLTCGIFAVQKAFESGKNKYDNLAGLMFGLGAACLITNLFFVVFLVAADIIRRKKISWAAYAIFFAAFTLPNYFIFLHPERFIRHIISHKLYSGYATFNFLDSAEFLWRAFSWGSHFIVIPVILLGLFGMFRKKNQFGIFVAVSGILFMGYDALLLRHQGIWAMGLPFIALYLAYGTELMLSSGKIVRLASIVFLVLALYILTAKVFFYRNALFPVYGNMTVAGEWINENVPPGSAIGVQGGWPIPGNVPAFRFLEYKIINLPYGSDEQVWENKKLPEYIITLGSAFDSIRAFSENYSLEKEWHKPRAYMGIPFERGWVPTENMDVRIYRKIKS